MNHINSILILMKVAVVVHTVISILRVIALMIIVVTHMIIATMIVVMMRKLGIHIIIRKHRRNINMIKS